MPQNNRYPNVSEIIFLHGKGLKNREIARNLDITHRTVAYHLARNSLKANGAKGGRLEIIDDKRARCSRCKNIHALEDWPTAREGKKYPYRLSYCRDCRRKQQYARLNGSSKAIVNDRFNKVRLRAKELGIEFNLTKEYLLNLYEKVMVNAFTRMCLFHLF